jgi:hypothetical protein
MVVFDISMVLNLLRFHPTWKSLCELSLWLSRYAHLASMLGPRGLLNYLQFLAYSVIQIKRNVVIFI